MIASILYLPDIRSYASPVDRAGKCTSSRESSARMLPVVNAMDDSVGPCTERPVVREAEWQDSAESLDTIFTLNRHVWHRFDHH